jgi:dihydropteroate synthase
MTLNCRGKLISLALPKVMGILNLTPDSFYDGGNFTGRYAALHHVEKMLKEGADFIDIGAMSTRPGAGLITEQEEMNRLFPLIEIIIQKFPEAIISVDTIRAEVAERALTAGAHIINDISAGVMDERMISTVAKYKVPFVIMHMQGTPLSMQIEPHYKNVVTEVYDFLSTRADACKNAGIMDVIIDVGFGFGKNVEHNYALLRDLNYFKNLRAPILSGLSRKSMICKVLNVNPDKALNGTTAANMLALLGGSNILRVHDVKEAIETIKIFEAYKGIAGNSTI